MAFSVNELKKHGPAILFGIAVLLIIFYAFLTGQLVNSLPWIAVILIFALLVWKGDAVIFLTDYQRAVIFRFGRVNRVGGPGWAFKIPAIENYHMIDLRTRTVDIPKHDVITKDNVELQVDSIIYLKVAKDKDSIIKSVVEIEDYKKAAELYVVSSIRNKIGSMTLGEVISNVDELNSELKKGLESLTLRWGIEVEAVEMKDVDVPRAVIDAMHEQKAAIQQRLARTERAEAQKIEIAAVKEAAADLPEKAIAYYYIKALEKMSQGKGTKIIFPMEFTKLAQTISSKLVVAPERLVESYKEEIEKNVESAVKKAKETERVPLIKIEPAAGKDISSIVEKAVSEKKSIEAREAEAEKAVEETIEEVKKELEQDEQPDSGSRIVRRGYKK